ncbi:DUF4192 domain-containing protein [Arthrobacter sp. FW305-BF8]|uniref:DUF4192 family protein n=1 Tax=Arthrobacter sp. FW305-BF8 TaxID=2879617 RepID=UPI001F34631C|nr:DUF4192 family protein [Arthrobacter sp. FW305-BF8]UKA56050.1 DUF4192 domain-containing protein [Arthrobacter sp. FW305-BF8]
MTAPEHLIISGPEDILGYIPHSLGYWPSQSLVAMTMQGKRLGATLRVDLPEGGGRRGREAFARTVAEYLLADKEADGTLLVFFADGGYSDSLNDDGLYDDGLNDDGREGAAALSFRPLLADLECALGLAGMPVRDAWRVGGEYWRNVYCTDSSCCPPPGRPIAEIRDSRLNAEMVYLGSSVGVPPGTPSPGAADTPAADNAVVMAAEREWTLALAGKGTLRAQFDAVLDAWAAALEAVSPEAVPGGGVPGGSALLAARSLSGLPDGLEPELAGFLRASLRVPAWRDAVLVMAAAGRAAAAAGAEAFGIFSAGERLPVSYPPLPERHVSPSCSEQGQAPINPNLLPVSGCDADALPGYGEVLLGLSPPVPDWDTLNRLEGLMEELSCGGGEAQAAALTAAGWIEWCRGRGSFAHASLTRALEASPGYRLAELLSEVVRRGTICGWAGRREAAWQKFGSDAA